jgi:hypothetical protein
MGTGVWVGGAGVRDGDIGVGVIAGPKIVPHAVSPRNISRNWGIYRRGRDVKDVRIAKIIPVSA